MGIVFAVFAVNVMALIYLTILRVMFWCRVRKMRQAYLKKKTRRGAFRKSTSRSLIFERPGSDPLNQAHGII